MESPTPMPQPAEPRTASRSVTIGVPAVSSPAERRFPLTPEGAGMLVDLGYTVKIEAGAAGSINYTDMQYTRAGAVIVGRDEALRCDIVLHLAPFSAADARKMRRGALLLSLLHAEAQDSMALRALLGRGVVAVALDMIGDRWGNRPFADILAEIDGRAAITLACSLLADPALGKGILIGGVAGVVPCELTVIGSGIAAIAAARSALGLGAMVRMFDNDIYRLRAAIRELGPGVTGSSLHPHVLDGALRSADIVVATPVAPHRSFDSDEVAVMKRGVITFDLGHDEAAAFPSMPTVDLASASPRDRIPQDRSRVCYINAGNAVPRTAAMALSNTFTTLIQDIAACGGIDNALKILPGIRQAVYLYNGRPVNERIAEKTGLRYMDINLILQFS